MSTNRTKIDWTYKWAKRFLANDNSFGLRSCDPDDIRALATLLRRAERRTVKRLEPDMKPYEPTNIFNAEGVVVKRI